MTTITPPPSASLSSIEKKNKSSGASQPPFNRQKALFLIKIILYVGTGILQPMIIDALRMQSCLGRKSLLLPTLAKTSGMALVGVLSTPSDRMVLRRLLRSDAEFRRSLFFAAFVDLLSGMLLTGGILLTGGAIFVVLYNSCPVWAALLSKCFLGRELTVQQAAGVLVVCLGLICNVFGTSEQLNGSSGSGKASTITVGSVVVLLGCVLHSGFFVLSDLSLRGHASGGGGCRGPSSDGTTSCAAPLITPPLWSSCLGSMEAVAMAIYVLSSIGVRGFQDPHVAPDTCSVSAFAKGYGFMLMTDCVHSAAFFLMLKQIGAVGSALLKGIQSVAVVLLSAAFFCPQEEAQCLTSIKAVSVILVLSGTFLYASGSRNDGTHFGTSKDTKGEKDKNVLPSVEVESLLDN
mmetsp:Transcript_18394/g.37049  ORF Transcript_18394/g.37049 Transcript_18394/m.37049 type:complete len:405 (-) Transcript_18394:270-1484(-)